MSPLPFRLLGEAQVKSFESLLTQAVVSWQKDWFPEESHIHIDLNDAGSLSHEDDWLILEQSQDLWIAWKSTPEATNCMVASLFNATAAASRSSELVKEIFAECVRSFSQKFLSNVVAARTGTLETLRAGYGSGALRAEIRSIFSRQHVVFSGGVVEKILGAKKENQSRYSLTRRESAIGKYKTKLEVTIGKAEITLADLANINIGDVIQLDTSIKQPLTIHAPAGEVVASGQLGILNNHKAVQLI